MNTYPTSPSKTLIVLTGGTIEALYNPEEGTPYRVPLPKTVNGSAIPQLVEKLGYKDGADFLKLSMSDSKEMARSALDTILHHAMEHDYSRIIIVQGTDTMPQHAQYLKQQIAELSEGAWTPTSMDLKKKTFVLTGAMTPLRGRHGAWRDEVQADGWRNMAAALQDVAQQPPGVYIQMGNYIDCLKQDRLDPQAPKQYLQGPWEADLVRKHVDTKRNPKTQVLEVERSGFVLNDPERHRIIPFS